MNGERQIKLTSIAFVLSAPVFITLDKGISLAPAYSADTVGDLIIPISYFLLPMLLAMTALTRRRVVIEAATIISAYLIIMLLLAGFFWGSTTGLTSEFTSRSLGRCLQAIIPVSAGVFASSFFMAEHDKIERARQVSRFAFTFSILIASFLGLYALQTLITGGGTRFSFFADHIGPFNNPKIKRFFPTLLAFSGAVIFITWMMTWNRGRQVSVHLLLVSILVFSGLFTFWSRTSALALFSSILASVFYIRMSRKSVVLALGMVGTILTAILIIDPSGWDNFTALSRLSNTALQLFSDQGEENYGDAIRFERVHFAFNQMMATPFGSGFATFRQELFPIEDIAIAENGFLDIGVRGGIFSLSIMIFLILRGGVRLHLWTRFDAISTGPLACAYWGYCVVSFFFLHLATETYSAMFFWFLIGAANALESPPLKRPPAL
ncbi:MAG: O-antigen ligase family protein [Paracoccaceae bacterium]|nr:O-antigen ligase family protein [Paracoccaceae bacterium]